ncbi:stage IV sporulation protein A [Oscillospiraceae bacterium]|uniref:stage IV sporulation protein A n=2 Tax=Allofournierella sp. TaxID=1940256 RepID=UPI0015AAF203|nr:stage IV sporulation protein A [Oscillospiraceae bacterium]
METANVYKDIAARTGGDIYIGVVGPVRTGKSTFVKKFMEEMILPQLSSQAVRTRARDELPQSAAGRTIMTTEPKFIPETAVTVELEGGGSFKARLIDCVGYMVDGAMGHEENDKPRMVKSPWYEEEIPFDLAAETGTQKVIRDHSTIGLVITTDGSISDIPREKYQAAEERVVAELEDINKPFVILLNCVDPKSAASRELAAQMEAQYGHTVLPISCVDLDGAAIDRILQSVLYEFDVKEIAFAMPKWITMLEPDHWLQTAVYSAAQDFAASIGQMKDVVQRDQPIQCEYLKESRIRSMQLATGQVTLELSLQPDIFYQVLGETTGLEICDEASLMPCIISLAKAKREYEKIRSAIEQVEATGYGIVMPTINELHLEEPEIVRQGGRYGVRLKASAPSIHLLKATINTEISPIVGSERQSEELVMSLLQDFEQDPIRIWESNIFGKSLHELVNEGLQNKLLHMPQEARARLQETLERVINEGCSGLICIIL